MTNDEKYAVVSTVDVIKKTYIISLEKLQELNTDAVVDISWASDSVVTGCIIPIVEHFADEVILSVDEMDWDQVVKHVQTLDEQSLKMAVDNCLSAEYNDDSEQ